MGRVVSLLLAAAAWSAAALGQDITLSAPGGPVVRGGSAVVLVAGLTDAELPAAVVEVQPAAGLTLLPGKLWGGGQNFVWVLVAADAAPGPRTLTVGLGRQYVPLHRALETQVQAAASLVREARQAAIAPEQLAPLEQLARDTAAAAASLRQQYPGRSGSCVLEVAGPLPPPPPPVPTPTGKLKILILEETEESTPALGRLAVGLQNGLTRAGKHVRTRGHQVEILDDDLPMAQTWWNRVPEPQRLPSRPCVVLFDLGSGAFVAAAELPAAPTEDQFLQLLQTHGG